MEAYCDQPAAAYLSRFLFYQIGDCRADFPYALLLVSGGHRCGIRSRFQSFKQGPQLGYRLVLRQHILLTRHLCSFLCFFMLLPNPATSGGLRNKIPGHRTRRIFEDDVSESSHRHATHHSSNPNSVIGLLWVGRPVRSREVYLQRPAGADVPRR